MSWISRRMSIISKIRETILEVVRAEKHLDEDALILEVQAENGCSRRTAREYIAIAQAQARKHIE